MRPDPLVSLCDGWQIASNLAAGFGDGITFGATAWVRKKLGSDGAVNKCSGIYKTASFAGNTVSGIILGYGVGKIAGKVVTKVGPKLGKVFGRGAKAAENAASKLNNEKTFYRNMSRAEAEAIKDTGKLRGGNSGDNFFTDSRFRSAERAKDRLSLPQEPEVQMEFRVKNDPHMVRNGTRVKPDYGGRGGGREYMTTDPVEVEIINVQPY